MSDLTNGTKRMNSLFYWRLAFPQSTSAAASTYFYSSNFTPLCWCKHTILPQSHTVPLYVPFGSCLSLKVNVSAFFPHCEFSCSELIIQNAILPEKATPDTSAIAEKLIKIVRTYQTSQAILHTNTNSDSPALSRSLLENLYVHQNTMLSHHESSAAQIYWIQHTSTLFYTGINWGNFLATVGQICLMWLW